MEAIVMTGENQKSGRSAVVVGGVVFVGCVMLGLAIGFLIGNLFPGILGGLGVGFVAMAIVMASDKEESGGKGASGVAFVGCILLGLAVGWFVGNVVVGIFGGLGVGFIAMAIIRFRTGQW
jgi:hypothetical protein